MEPLQGERVSSLKYLAKKSSVICPNNLQNLVQTPFKYQYWPKRRREHSTLCHTTKLGVVLASGKSAFNKAKCVVHKRKYKVLNAICFDIL